MYAPDEFVALEVKNAGQVRDRDLDGLQAFLADYPNATAVLLYRGTERLRERGIWCLPIEPFLRALHPARSVRMALAITPAR